MTDHLRAVAQAHEGTAQRWIRSYGDKKLENQSQIDYFLAFFLSKLP